MYEEYLAHYGIKGMKWGVRKAKDSVKKSGKKISKEGKERSSRFQKVLNRRTMDTKDLQKAVERLKMEKELKQLTEEDLTPGRAFVKDMVKKTANKVIPVVAAGTAMYGIKVAVEKKWGSQAASYIAPNIWKKK